MGRASMASDFHHVEMANKVRLHVGMWILYRVADPGLGSEVDDLFEFACGKCRIQGSLIGKIDFHEVEAIAEIGLLLGDPGALQLNRIIIVHVIQRDNRLSALHQPACNVKSDEPGTAGH